MTILALLSLSSSFCVILLLKLNILNLLSISEQSFLCVRPSRYVFPGAEVYSDDDGDDESDNESVHNSHADNVASSTSSEENNEKEGGSVNPSFKEKLDKIDGVGYRNGIAQHSEGMGDHAS